MTEIKLFIIFIVVLVLDGLVLPAFFGFRESFLSLLVMVIPLLYLGSTRRSVTCGLVFALIYESLRGLELGALVLPFLLTAVVIYSAQRFLDIKYTYDTRFGLQKSVFIALTSVVLIHIFSFFYKHGSVSLGYFDLALNLTVALEALILVFIFNIVFNKKTDY